MFRARSQPVGFGVLGQFDYDRPLNCKLNIVSSDNAHPHMDDVFNLISCGCLRTRVWLLTFACGECVLYHLLCL